MDNTTMETVKVKVQSTAMPEEKFDNYNDWAEKALARCRDKKNDLIAVDMKIIPMEKIRD